jgi:flagellar basal body-associated protein FliL
MGTAWQEQRKKKMRKKGSLSLSILSGLFLITVAFEGGTAFFREKHTLSNEVAYEATSLLGSCSWKVFNNA